MRSFFIIIAILLLLTACGSKTAMQVQENTKDAAQNVQEVPQDTVPEPNTVVVKPNVDTPKPVGSVPSSVGSVPSAPPKDDTSTVSKTQEVLDKMYSKIKDGVKYVHTGDTIYLKGDKDHIKMTIAFGQMYTIPGSQRTDFALADQMDIAYFDLATGKGKGYCLGRVKGSEFSCNDLQKRAFDLSFTSFAEQYALYYLEQHKDVDPDVYARKAEQVEGVGTSRLEYGQGADKVIIWISQYNDMPMKVAQRIKDPYTKETHYQDWEFGVSDETMIDPFV